MKYLSMWPNVSDRNEVWRDFNSLVEEFGRGFGLPSEIQKQSFRPLIDVEESDTSYTVEVDLPGSKKDEIKIEVVDNVLNVSGERKREEKRNGHSERLFGQFRRSVSLPKDVDASAIEAEFTDGVLKIFVPKSKESQVKTITIK